MHRRYKPIEAHVILATCEDLWEALKRRPNGLTKEEKRKLKELDGLLKAHAHWVTKVLGEELPKWCRRFKPPRSHWWWFLDKMVRASSPPTVKHRPKADVTQTFRKGADGQ